MASSIAAQHRPAPAPVPAPSFARPDPVQTLEAAPRVAQLEAIGAALNGAVIQRAVLKSRKTGKWYSDRAPEKFFETKEEAQVHDRKLSNAEVAARKSAKRAASAKRIEERRAAFRKNYPNYVAPTGGRARVFKDSDKHYDDADIVSGDAAAIKRYSELGFQQRRARLFRTTVLKLGPFRFVLTPGTDIGAVPADDRPDLRDRSEGRVPLSRQGKPRTYKDLALDVDKIAARLVKETGLRLATVRARMGRDVDRASRGHALADTHEYSETDRATLHELAAVVRLDKGRAPGATSYIRRTFISGKKTFAALAAGAYVGGPKQGAKALRGIAAEEKAADSEGSDLESVGVDIAGTGKRARRVVKPPPRKRSRIEKEAEEKPQGSTSGGGGGTEAELLRDLQNIEEELAQGEDTTSTQPADDRISRLSRQRERIEHRLARSSASEKKRRGKRRIKVDSDEEPEEN